MTTQVAASLHLAQHRYDMDGRGVAVHNPNNLPESELPIIYGFHNDGSSGMLSAQLLAEDGTSLGGHACTGEGYMLNDLGILKGTRPDRHETFQQHYPDGYRMVFVGLDEVASHPGLEKAYQRNQEQAKTNAK